MRRLLWFTLGFALSIGLCVWLIPQGWGIWVLLFFGTAGLLLRRREIPSISLLALGCVLGLIWFLIFQRYYLLPVQALDGTKLETTVAATGYSWATDYGQAVDGEFTLQGKTYQIRLYVNTQNPIEPGDALSGTFRMRYTAPGGQRDATYHAGEGILLLGYESGMVEHRRNTQREASHFPAILAQSIKERLALLFPEDVFPFVQALLLGDTSQLDYATDTALSISGIRHIVAVSGLHVAILYTLIRNLTFRKRWLTALLGFPVLLLFCAVAGFRPAVTRSCIMVGLMLLAQLLKKEYDPPTSLSFAVLVMLLENPLVITSIAFQMSVGCVASILLFQQPIARWLVAWLGDPKGKSLGARLRRWLISSVSTSVSAVVLTAPLSACYFGTVSLVGVVTNLLTLWAVNLVFNGIVIACLVSLVWMQGAVWLSWLLAWAVRYVLLTAKILAAFPLAAVYTRSGYIIAWLVFVYVLLGAFLISRKRHPLVLGCCATIGLCIALLFSWLEPRQYQVHMTVLDVGQGQSIILHCENRTFLIDCGGSSDETAADAAAQTLLSRGVTHLDGIILTHGDRDHSGGIPYLLTRISADWILLPATTEPEVAAGIAGNSDAEQILVSDDLLVALDRAELRIFGPTFAAESNENSLCILFESENCDILITGDRGQLGEALLMQACDLPQVELLVAGHHGSKYSTSAALLEAVQPELVVISVGAHNAYGHPAQELLARLIQFGCQVLRTDQNGTIIFRR